MGGGPSAAVYGRQRKQEVRNKKQDFRRYQTTAGAATMPPLLLVLQRRRRMFTPAEIEPYSDTSASRDRAARALRLRRKNAQPSPSMRAACAAEGKKPTGNSNSKVCLPPRALTFYLFTLKIVALILLNVFFIQSFLLTFAANLTSCFLFLTFFGQAAKLI